MEPIFILFLTLFIVWYSEAVCPSGTTVSFSDLAVGFQQIQGTAQTTSFAHALTTAQTVSGQTCSKINSALFLTAATTNCPVDCLTTLTPYKYTNGTSYVDIAMLRPGDLALFPSYSQSGTALNCVAISGNCGANVPIYGFYSSAYADHFASSDNTLPDSTYSYDFSGYPLCFGWKMPTTTADKLTIANKYTGTSPVACYVADYLGLTVSTTTNAMTSTTNKATATSTTAKTSSTISAASTTTSSSGTTTKTTAATTAPVTTQATTTTKPVTVAVTDTSGKPITDSSGKPVTATVANTATASSDPKNSNTWKWVVLGVGLGVLALAVAALLFFFFSNFRGRTPTNARINPYDRDLYTTDGMGDAPPVPVNSLPAQGSMPVIHAPSAEVAV